jgi:hypothetical protein
MLGVSASSRLQSQVLGLCSAFMHDVHELRDVLRIFLLHVLVASGAPVCGVVLDSAKPLFDYLFLICWREGLPECEVIAVLDRKSTEGYVEIFDVFRRVIDLRQLDSL